MVYLWMDINSYYQVSYFQHIVENAWQLSFKAIVLHGSCPLWQLSGGNSPHGSSPRTKIEIGIKLETELKEPDLDLN